MLHLAYPQRLPGGLYSGERVSTQQRLDDQQTCLLDGPAALEAGVYLEPALWGGGAVTNAVFPGFRFRFKRLRSRADSVVISTSGQADVGEGSAGVIDPLRESES